MNPFFQRDIDSLSFVSPRFLATLVLNAVLLVPCVPTSLLLGIGLVGVLRGGQYGLVQFEGLEC